MQQQFLEHLKEVRSHYDAADFSLGHRRLLDSAIETRNPAIFKETLEYCDWWDHNEKADADSIRNKVNILLEKIAKAGISEQLYQKGPILSVQSVGKSYAYGSFRLNDVSLELSSSEIIGLVGENGNGKTTLLRLLARELSADKGIITYHFVDKSEDEYDLRSRLVYIEQRIPKWHGSLMDNLQFTLAMYGITGEKNILWAELMVARLGLRPFRHLSWKHLSSGYRTRFEIAKTLLRNPRILLLDEPLANLDIISQQTILQDLKYMATSISAPFAMILSSQHIYEVEKVSDRIIFLKQGTPQYQQSMKEESSAESELILEMEVEASREELMKIFSGMALKRIQFNGGVYIMDFSAGTNHSEVLGTLAKAGLPVNYFRNISKSSRRFFVNN